MQLISSPELLVPWKHSQEVTRASAVPIFTRILECVSPFLFYFFTKPHANNWPRQTFLFPGSCLIFTHISFLFLNLEFLKTLAQGRMSLQKATRASLVPWKVQVFQSPLDSLLQTGCSVVWRGPSALRKSELAWGRPALSYPQTLLQSEKCSSYQHVSKQQQMTSRTWKHEKLPRQWAVEKVFGLCAGCPLLLLRSRGLVTEFHVGCHSVGTGVLTGSTSDNVRNTFTTGSRC